MVENKVTLRPMMETEYQSWYEYCVVEYAKDKRTSLNISDGEALKLSKETFLKHLPDGMDTPDNFLYSVFDADGVNVGYLWLGLMHEWGVTKAFIFDIEMKEMHRRKGFGRATLQVLETVAREKGASQIGLHLFGANKAAKSLYEKTGYHITDISMLKNI